MPAWLRNSAFARMALRGWRRSWEMRATILLRVESGSGKGRPDSMPHNDSAGNDRRLRTARSSIQTLRSVVGRSPDRRTISCSGIAMHSVWSALRKGTICTFAAQAPCALIIYQISLFGVLLWVYPRPGLLLQRHFFDSATHRLGPSFRQIFPPFLKAL
jgi:hypothetical protein